MCGSGPLDFCRFAFFLPSDDYNLPAYLITDLLPVYPMIKLESLQLRYGARFDGLRRLSVKLMTNGKGDRQ